MPNVEEIAKKMADERVDKITREFQEERNRRDDDLQNRVEKVLKLEMELDEVKDAYRQLEASMSKEDQHYKNRSLKLEKSLEQITQMYQHVMNEKQIIKVDLQVAEKKMQRKEEKIVQLEKSLALQRDKVKRWLKIAEHPTEGSASPDEERVRQDARASAVWRRNGAVSDNASGSGESDQRRRRKEADHTSHRGRQRSCGANA